MDPEPEVKVETVDDSGEDSLPVQFIGMTSGTGIKLKDEPADGLIDEIKVLPYKVLDDALLKSTMGSVSFLSELTINFEEKLKMKMFRMMALLDAVCKNINNYGAMTDWNWESITAEVNKTSNKSVTLSVPDVQKKTLVLLEWLVRKDSSLVKIWKSDVAKEEFLQTLKPSGEEAEDFVVVKAEQDDFHNSSGDVTEEVPVSPVKIKTEKDPEEGTSEVVTGPVDSAAIPTDMQVMKAAEVSKERFFHNGEELDLEDVLDTYTDDSQTSSSSKKQNPTAKEVEEGDEEDEEEEDEDEEDMEQNEDEKEYKPSDSDASEAEELAAMEEDEEDDKEEDEDEEEGGEEGGKDEEDDADPGSTSLNMLKQALMRKRGQTQVPIQQNVPDTETSVQGSASSSTTSITPLATKANDANIGGTSLSIKDLTEIERTVLEATVASNIEVFKTTASTVEEREKKMSVWREIAKKVNASGGKNRTPEELVTIWSKKLFVDHVSSKKSLLVNKDPDKTVNGTATNTAFRSLISKSVPDQSEGTQKRVTLTPASSLPSAGLAKSMTPIALTAGQTKTLQFTPEEQRVFSEQLEKFKPVFHGSQGDKTRAETLKEVWQEITDQVNAVNHGPPRTPDELQKKWTLELIQNKSSNTSSYSQQNLARKLGRPLEGTPSVTSTKTQEVYPVTTKPSSTVSSTITSAEEPLDIPIKIELDNAESDQTQILHVVPQAGSTSYATPVPTAESPANVVPGISPSSNQSSQSEAGMISFQLMDPVTMDMSTVSLPKSCVKLQLVDNSAETVSSSGDASSSSIEIKDEPEDQAIFTTMQSKVVTEFISTKIHQIKVTGPSIISLVMHSVDWENLVKLVNEADPSLIHTMNDVKNKVTKTIKLMDNMLPVKMGTPAVTAAGDATSHAVKIRLTKNEERVLQTNVKKHLSVLLDPRETKEVNQARTSVWKVITGLINASYNKNYSWGQMRQAAADYVKKLSQSETHKRTHSESPDPETLIKKIKVEKEEDLVSPRWAMGDLVQAKHEDVWYEATIVDIDEDQRRAKVHFNGLTRRSDKWVTMTKEFLTHTSRCLVKMQKLPQGQ